MRLVETRSLETITFSQGAGSLQWSTQRLRWVRSIRLSGTVSYLCHRRPRVPPIGLFFTEVSSSLMTKKVEPSLWGGSAPGAPSMSPAAR